MRKPLSIAVCFSLAVSFIVGSGCASIPDTRGGSSASTTDGGSGGHPSGGSSGASSGGQSGTGTGGTGAGGAGSGGASGAPTGGAGGGVISSEAGVAEGGTVEPGIPCGTSVCHSRHVGQETLSACCAGTNKDQCGIQTIVLGALVCVQPNQVGGLDTTCPDQYPDDGTGQPDYSKPPMKGCCKPGVGGLSRCGLLVPDPGGPNLGCVDPAEIGQTMAVQKCTPPVCAAAGATCKTNSDCCTGPAGPGACIDFSSGSVCTSFCKTNADCASGCCSLLVNNRGVCAPDASKCSKTCRKIDESCDTDGDCCTGAVCATNSSSGPRLCRPTCKTNADCPGELCVKDAAGRATCSTTGSGLCSDTCTSAKDGSCDDGGDANAYDGCALGTDCTDCGPRLGGFQYCSNTCATANNGVCEDGTGTVKPTCDFGTDCNDCKPMLGLCSDDCVHHDDGVCDDGGLNAADYYCAFGTDCADCSGRFGGRGQSKCDGTTGTHCTPNGDVLEDYWYLASGCECADCAWDSGPLDCGNDPTKPIVSPCDGKTMGYCCAPGDPCGWEGDGTCDCGGWCAWEKKDCGMGSLPPKCDGYSIKATCLYPGTITSSCDCGGACSWETGCSSYGTSVCKDTCSVTGATSAKANNTKCEDGGPGSINSLCALGTDCADCGPRL
jgi:hypothetical protein